MSTFRDYSRDPAPAEVDERDPRIDEQDYGNCIACEHINLEVPDLEIARLFYSEVLGLAPDPSRVGSQRGNAQVVWYNIGRQQIHIAKAASAQRLPPGATIGLVLPGVDAISKAAKDLRPMLGEVPITTLAHGVIQITDPNGVSFVVHQHYKGFLADRGIAYIHLPCFVGTSPLIARFYGHTLGAPVKLLGQPLVSPQVARSTIIDETPRIRDRAQDEIEKEVIPKAAGGAVSSPRRQRPTSSPRAHDVPNYLRHVSGARAVVMLGTPGTHLVFYEEPSLGPWSTQGVLDLFSGWHICFYISQFSHCYSRLRALIYNDHRYKDKVHRFHDALDYHQFRFEDVVLIPDPFGPPTLEIEGKRPEVSTHVIQVTPAGGLTVPNSSTTLSTPATSADGSRRQTSDNPLDAPTNPQQPAATANAAHVEGAGGNDGAAEQAALVARSPGHMVPVTSIVLHQGDQATAEGVPNQNGQLLYRIAHEVRSLAHPNFLRPLYNRPHGFM